MATAILDYDLNIFLDSQPNVPIKLPNYQRAFVLIRYKGNPIGSVYIPVINEHLTKSEVYSHMIKAVKSTYWKHQVENFLEWDERNLVEFVIPKSTIAVCTRNRTEDLKRCLNALIQLPDDGQEILIIDNCPSTDETKQLVETYKNVRYVNEPKAGLNNARNRALLEAQNEVVAFIDDDAIPDSNWLRAILKNFNSPKVMCVCGLTVPLELETDAQEAFEKFSPFSKGFTRRVFTRNSGNPIATSQMGAGANMALRKSLLEKVGTFDEALDAGTPTQSGGDHEMFARILLAGFHIIYDPFALNWHRHHRTWDELHKTIYGYGVGVYALLTRHLVVNSDFSVFKIAYQWFYYKQLRELLKTLLRHPNHQPLDLILAELKGCLIGPWAYYSSRRKSSSRKTKTQNETYSQYRHSNA